MNKTTVQNDYINFLNDFNKKHNYYNKNKFINYYIMNLYHAGYFTIKDYEIIKETIKKHLRGFKPLTSTIKF